MEKVRRAVKSCGKSGQRSMKFIFSNEVDTFSVTKYRIKKHYLSSLEVNFHVLHCFHFNLNWLKNISLGEKILLLKLLITSIYKLLSSHSDFFSRISTVTENVKKINAIFVIILVLALLSKVYIIFGWPDLLLKCAATDSTKCLPGEITNT